MGFELLSYFGRILIGFRSSETLKYFVFDIHFAEKKTARGWKQMGNKHGSEQGSPSAPKAEDFRTTSKNNFIRHQRFHRFIVLLGDFVSATRWYCLWNGCNTIKRTYFSLRRWCVARPFSMLIYSLKLWSSVALLAGIPQRTVRAELLRRHYHAALHNRKCWRLTQFAMSHNWAHNVWLTLSQFNNKIAWWLRNFGKERMFAGPHSMVFTIWRFVAAPCSQTISTDRDDLKGTITYDTFREHFAVYFDDSMLPCAHVSLFFVCFFVSRALVVGIIMAKQLFKALEDSNRRVSFRHLLSAFYM